MIEKRLKIIKIIFIKNKKSYGKQIEMGKFKIRKYILEILKNEMKEEI